MRKTGISIVFILCSLIGAENIDLSLILKNDYHYYLEGPSNPRHAIDEEVIFKGEVEANELVKGVFDLRIANPNLLSEKYTIEADELYIDALFTRSAIKLGKQKIVWGKFDAFSPIEGKNPKDLTDMFDHNDTKLGEPALLYSYFNDFFTVNTVVAPLFVKNRYAEADSKWYSPTQTGGLENPLLKDFSMQTTFNDRHQQSIRNDFEAGVNVSIPTNSVDLSLSYYYSHDRFPVVDTSIAIDLVNQNIHITKDIDYRRMHIYDLGVVVPYNNFVFRAEAGLFIPEESNANFYSPNEIYGKSVIGVEYVNGSPRIGKQHLIQGQWMKEYNEDFSYIANDINHIFGNSFLLRYQLTCTDNLKTIGEALYNLIDDNYFIRLEVPYTVADGFTVSAMYEIFSGEEDTFLAPFSVNDRFKFTTTWGF